MVEQEKSRRSLKERVRFLLLEAAFNAISQALNLEDTVKKEAEKRLMELLKKEKVHNLVLDAFALEAVLEGFIQQIKIVMANERIVAEEPIEIPKEEMLDGLKYKVREISAAEEAELSTHNTITTTMYYCSEILIGPTGHCYMYQFNLDSDGNITQKYCSRIPAPTPLLKKYCQQKAQMK